MVNTNEKKKKCFLTFFNILNFLIYIFFQFFCCRIFFYTEIDCNDHEPQRNAALYQFLGPTAMATVAAIVIHDSNDKLLIIIEDKIEVVNSVSVLVPG